MKNFVLLALLVFISNFPNLKAANKETTDSSLLTFSKIFDSKDFKEEKTKWSKWMENSSKHTVLEDSKVIEDGKDIVAYTPGDKKGEIIVSADKLIPKGDKKPLEIYDYFFSKDKTKMLIFTNTKKVWRLHTKGDYWLLNLKTNVLKKLGGNAEKSTLMFATFSPNSKLVAYVIKHNIYVEDITTGKITKLTKDGNDKIINGTFDWVYEEEFSLRNGFRWSPDSKKIAYWQLDASNVKDFYLINYTDSLYPKITPVQYPKAGEKNSSSKLGVVNATGGNTVWMKLQGDASNHYLPRMDWAANSNEIVFQRMNRLQNTNTLYVGNSETGNCKVILVEKDNAWLDTVDNLQFFENGKYFLWVSEREGFRKLYLVSRDGKKFTKITPKDYDVISILRIDNKGEWAYFLASPQNPTEKYLFRASLKNPGVVEKIKVNKKGTHTYSISKDGKFAIHYFSTFDSAPTTDIVSLPEHRHLQTLVDNKKLEENLKKLKRKPVEFFTITTKDKVKLYGWCMKPYNFNPTKKYPVLFHVYGEPAGLRVVNRYFGRNYLWHTMLTQMGYIVISIDNRGTPSPRGREFRKCVYGAIGVKSSLDQAQSVEALLSERPYLDKNKIGIWGWSGGGSMSLNAIFRYPEIYSTAMSVAPVANQKYYDSIYQERYMGLPSTNAEGYKQGSPINFAKNLKGNLLLIHGTGDDNVHFQNTESLINELIRYNKLFSLMIYPNRSHSIKKGKNTTKHVYETLTKFLTEKMPVV